MHSGAVLQASGLRKSNGGLVALDGVDLALRAGEIHGLCGENGAGKSTRVKILGGLVAPGQAASRWRGPPCANVLMGAAGGRRIPALAAAAAAGPAGEAANVIVFPASDLASFVTSSAGGVDGGSVRSIVRGRRAGPSSPPARPIQ